MRKILEDIENINESLFKIGTKFIRYNNKKGEVETIEDIYTTTNSKGETVKQVYVTSHEYGGHKVFDYEVARATVARSKMIE